VLTPAQRCAIFNTWQQRSGQKKGECKMTKAQKTEINLIARQAALIQAYIQRGDVLMANSHAQQIKKSAHKLGA
jgi:hypothetical protein